MSFHAEHALARRPAARALLALSATLALSIAAAEDIAPDVLVKTVTQEVIDIIAKDQDIKAGDRKKTIALVDAKVLPHFNFMRMTSQAVAQNWSKATPEQQKRLAEEFRTLLVRTYASSISAYYDKRFNFMPLRARADDTDVTVNVRVIQPGAQAVQIDYDMEKTAAGWKVWDVRVAGISLVVNYRTEFANVVRDSGIDGLIRSIAAKNASLEAPAVAQKK